MADSKPENPQPLVESSSSSDERITCQICFNPYGCLNPEGRKESGVLTPCGHVFGSRCLQVWKDSTSQLTCPMCRVLLQYRKCSHPIMPLPMSLSVTVKAIPSAAFPKLCLDCEHHRLRTKLLEDWAHMLDERYTLGGQSLRLLLHWEFSDISSEDPSWDDNIRARIDDSLKNMATDERLTQSAGEVEESATIRAERGQSLAAEGGSSIEVAGENDNGGQPARAESLDIHVSIEREPTPSRILGNGVSESRSSEAMSDLDSAAPQPRSQGQSPDQDMQDAQSSSSRSEITEEDEVLDDEGSETDDGERSDYDPDEEEGDDDYNIRQGTPESEEVVLSKVQTYNQKVLSFLRNARKVLELLRQEREEVERNPKTWRLLFDKMENYL